MTGEDLYPKILIINNNEEDNKYIIDKYKKDMTICFTNNDEEIYKKLSKERPNVIITFGDWKNYNNISNLSLNLRRRWLNYKNVKEMNINDINETAIKNNRNEKNDEPLISFFTASFESKDKIYRPYNSLRDSYYKNWEWVIMNDANDEDQENFNILLKLAEEDPRVRVYKRQKHSGFIGELKNEASLLCRGDYLCELDHDDEIVPHLMNYIVDAFNRFPDAGFLYTNFTEPYFGTSKTHSYGYGWGYGYGSYYQEYYPVLQKNIDSKYYNSIVYVAKAPTINPVTLSNIASSPNHIRCWRTTTFPRFNPQLPVSDDYEIIIRTFLCTKFIHLPIMGYLQYRNPDGNTTFKRINQITKIQSLVYNSYKDELNKRFMELGSCNENLSMYDLTKITTISHSYSHNIIQSSNVPYPMPNFNYTYYLPYISIIIYDNQLENINTKKSYSVEFLFTSPSLNNTNSNNINIPINGQESEVVVPYSLASMTPIRWTDWHPSFIVPSSKHRFLIRYLSSSIYSYIPFSTNYLLSDELISSLIESTKSNLPYIYFDHGVLLYTSIAQSIPLNFTSEKDLQFEISNMSSLSSFSNISKTENL